jgi:hypothetical protein
MDAMTPRELQWLVGPHDPPCVSLYMPTHRHHPGTEQDRIRFKNLVNQAAELLRRDFTEPDVTRFLKSVEVLSDEAFWRHQEDGLAVFRSLDTQAHYRLPAPMPEQVVVADTFHTRPLIGYLHGNRHYFVLALSQNEVKLYGGTPHGLSEIEFESLNPELRQVMKEYTSRPQLSVRGGGKTGSQAAYHGHGAGDEDHKKELAKYFRAIDKALWPMLRDERAPLVLAAVGYHHPLFQAASRYPYILDQGVEGNVERMSLDDLRQAAWGLVSAHESGVEEALFEQLGRALGQGRASCSLVEIARAAAHGRVRSLLHVAGQTVWGRLDPHTGEVVVHERQEDSQDADLIDDVCELVMLRGGEIFEVGPHPGLQGSPVGALYRY